MALSLSFLFVPFFVFSQTTNLEALQEEIDEKQTHIDQINRKVDEYNQQIEKHQTAQITLLNETALLDNRLAKTTLEIEGTEEEIKNVHAKLRLINGEITQKELQLKKQQEILTAVLHAMQVQDRDSLLEIVFASDSFSDVFDGLHYLQELNGELRKSLNSVKEAKQTLMNQRDKQTVTLASLQEFEKTLEAKKRQFGEELEAKTILFEESQESEAVFQELLRELRQEQQYIDNQIAYLQATIEKRLYEQDEIGDTSALTWPFYPQRGISATFHDPSYPFRHLFEHSGLDLPASTGTPVASAAPGYVAWARQGRLYGNYVMVIHTNGLATLYAHLSQINVQTDQFVSRGDILGLVGSTGLSTGPHLHFEVRKYGIPVNPLDYLLSY